MFGEPLAVASSDVLDGCADRYGAATDRPKPGIELAVQLGRLAVEHEMPSGTDDVIESSLCALGTDDCLNKELARDRVASLERYIRMSAGALGPLTTSSEVIPSQLCPNNGVPAGPTPSR